MQGMHTYYTLLYKKRKNKIYNKVYINRAYYALFSKRNINTLAEFCGTPINLVSLLNYMDIYCIIIQ